MLDWLSKFLFAFSRRTLKLSVPLLTELVQCTELCTVAPAASDIILLFRKMRSSPQNVFPDPAPNVSLMARDSLESVTTGHPRTKKAKFRISRFIFETCLSNMKQIVQHFFIFLRSEAGWTINFILAHLLFWCYGGFETVRTNFFKRFYRRNRNFGNGDHGSCDWFMTQSIVSSFSISTHHLQLRDFGYNNSTGEIGNIPSGSNGSGIVPVTLSLMIGMTLIWISKLITFDSTCSKGGENKD